jgi:hypothetical protein
MDTMNPNSSAQRVVAEVEALTGCPVEVRQDASIKKMAVLEMARGPLRVHLVRIHPSFRDHTDYLTCLECGYILRKHVVQADKRMDFAANPKGLRELQQLVFEYYANKRMPADVLRGLAEQLYQGLMTQLISIPSSMRVDAWVAETFPELLDHQKTMVRYQLQDALDSLKPDARKVAPEKITRPSLTMNAAYAQFWSRRWDDPLLVMPYRTANLSLAGNQLLEIFDAIPPEPANDVALVDAWARILKLNNIYRWVPYKLDHP